MRTNITKDGKVKKWRGHKNHLTNINEAYKLVRKRQRYKNIQYPQEHVAPPNELFHMQFNKQISFSSLIKLRNFFMLFSGCFKFYWNYLLGYCNNNKNMAKRLSDCYEILNSNTKRCKVLNDIGTPCNLKLSNSTSNLKR